MPVANRSAAVFITRLILKRGTPELLRLLTLSWLDNVDGRFEGLWRLELTVLIVFLNAFSR